MYNAPGISLQTPYARRVIILLYGVKSSWPTSRVPFNLGASLLVEGCEILAFALDGQVAALTVIRLDPANKIGLFEPVATRPAFRRRGLVRALMLHGLCEMKSLGIETARVEYEAANLPAGELYRRLGFQKRYETLGYRRQ